MKRKRSCRGRITECSTGCFRALAASPSIVRIEALPRALEAQRVLTEAHWVNIESLHVNVHDLWEASQRHDAAAQTLLEQLLHALLKER